MRSEIAAAGLFLVLSAGSARAGLVERVVAVVDGRAVCLSDVRAVEKIDGVDAAAAVARLVDETLQFQEAFRLPQALEDEGAQAADEPAERRVRRRRAVIARYVELRFRPQVRVDDDSVRDAYVRETGGDPEGPAFEAAADALRERLVRAEVARRVAEWVRDLRTAARVRYNAD